MLNRLYLYLGSLVPLGFAVMVFMGWEPGDEPRERIDPNASGGIRSHYFFVAGYRGGK